MGGGQSLGRLPHGGDSFLDHPDNSIGAEKPPLEFQQLTGLSPVRHWIGGDAAGGSGFEAKGRLAGSCSAFKLCPGSTNRRSIRGVRRVCFCFWRCLGALVDSPQGRSRSCLRLAARHTTTHPVLVRASPLPPALPWCPILAHGCKCHCQHDGGSSLDREAVERLLDIAVDHRWAHAVTNGLYASI